MSTTNDLRKSEELKETTVLPPSNGSTRIWTNSDPSFFAAGLSNLQKNVDQNGDETAKVVLDIYDRHEEEFQKMRRRIEEEIKGFRKTVDEYKDELKKDLGWTNKLVIGIVVALVFILITTFWDIILSNKSDREILLKYNDVYKGYYDASISQKEEINSLHGKIKNLENEIKSLRDRNSYLK